MWQHNLKTAGCVGCAAPEWALLRLDVDLHCGIGFFLVCRITFAPQFKKLIFG